MIVEINIENAKSVDIKEGLSTLTFRFTTQNGTDIDLVGNEDILFLLKDAIRIIENRRHKEAV